MKTIVIRTTRFDSIVGVLQMFLAFSSAERWKQHVVQLKGNQSKEQYELLRQELDLHKVWKDEVVEIREKPLRVGASYRIHMQHGEDTLTLQWNGLWHLEARGTHTYCVRILKEVVSVDAFAIDGIYDGIDYFTLEEVLKRTEAARIEALKKK